MGKRAEMRRAAREQKKRAVVYQLSQEQLDAKVDKIVGDKFKEIKEAATHDAINAAMELMLLLPMKVLIEQYWPKTYQKKLPEFENYLVSEFAKWQNGELDIEALRETLFETCGIKIEMED